MVVHGGVHHHPGSRFDAFDPANIAPLVVWLGSPGSSGVTGRVFEAEGGKISIADGWRSTEVRDALEWLRPLAGLVQFLPQRHFHLGARHADMGAAAARQRERQFAAFRRAVDELAKPGR